MANNAATNKNDEGPPTIWTSIDDMVKRYDGAENREEAIALYEEDRRLLDIFMQLKILSAANFATTFSGAFNEISLPTEFHPTTRSLAMYTGALPRKVTEEMFESGEARERNQKYIFSTALALVIRNPEKYNVRDAEVEVTFIWLHEVYHALFKHLIKQKRLENEYPMPSSAYNIAFDIFINTLVKYNPGILSLLSDGKTKVTEHKDLSIYNNCMRFYESKEEVKESLKQRVGLIEQMTGEEADPDEIWLLNVITAPEVEEMSDNELVRVLYDHLKDFLDEYQSIFEQALQDVLQDGQNGNDPNAGAGKGQPTPGGTSTPDPTGSQEGQEQGQDGDDEDSQSGGAAPSDQDGQGDQEPQEAQEGSQGDQDQEDDGGDQDEQQTGSGDGWKDFQEKLNERVMEGIKEKAQNDPKFKEAVKKYFANLPELPSTSLQASMEAIAESGSMTADEMIDAMKAKGVIRDLVSQAEDKMQGTLPGWLRAFGDVKPERPAWADVIRTFGKRALGQKRATYSPPNKRHTRADLLVASRIDDQADLGFVIDTSGSMGDDEILPVISQIEYFVRNAPQGTNFHLLFNDAKVSYHLIKGKKVKALRELLKNGVQGGGGSVFTECFRHPALKKVDALIFLSDFFIGFDDDLRLRKPTLLLYTEYHDEGVLREFKKRARPCIAVPAGKLD